MPTVLQEKIAGMTEQQAQKLSRELLTLHPNMGYMQSEYPLLDWLCKVIRLEGSIEEQVHICTACNRGLHLGDSHTYTNHDQKVWQCKCPKCERNK